MYGRVKADNFFTTTTGSLIDSTSYTGTFTVASKVVNGYTLEDGAYVFWMIVGIDNQSELEIFRITNVSSTTLTYDKRISPNGLHEHAVGQICVMTVGSDFMNYISDNTNDFGYTETIQGTGNELKIKIYGGRVENPNGADVVVADTTLTLTDNTTSYIYFDDVDNTFKSGATEPDAYKVVASVVTLSGAITTLTDLRAVKAILGSVPLSLTTTQRLALVGVRNGTFIFDSTIGENLQYLNGSWYPIAAGSTQPNASETEAGKVEIRSAAERISGVRTGDTGAILVAGNTKNEYDAIVHPTLGDYPTIGAAIVAGATNIFVANGSYTETSWTTGTSHIQITGESRDGVIVTFNNTSSHNSSYIYLDTCTGLIVKNISFSIGTNETNKYFLYGSSSMVSYPFAFKNCKFTLTSTGTSTTKYFIYNFVYTSFSYNNLPSILEKDYDNGFFGCEFYTEYSGDYFRISGTGGHYYKGCSFTTGTTSGRINIIGLSLLRDCNVDAFSVGLNSVSLDRTVISVKDTGKVSGISGGEDGAPLLYFVKDSHIIYNGTLAVNTSITLYYTVSNSYISVQAANISLPSTSSAQPIKGNIIITTGTFTSSQHHLLSNNITASTLSIVADNDRYCVCNDNTFVGSPTFAINYGTISGNNISGNTVAGVIGGLSSFTGNHIAGTLTIAYRYSNISGNTIQGNVDFTSSGYDNAFTGNKCGTITIVANANNNVITGNQNGAITDGGTGTIKYGNRNN